MLQFLVLKPDQWDEELREKTDDQGAADAGLGPDPQRPDLDLVFKAVKDLLNRVFLPVEGLGKCQILVWNKAEKSFSTGDRGLSEDTFSLILI